MSGNNPFNTPVAALETQPAELTGLVPDAIIEQLRRTKPWLFFFAVLGMLSAGLGVLGGMMMIGSSFFMAETPGMEAMPWMMPVLGVVYFIFAAGSAAPTLLLLKQTSAITNLVAGRSMDALEKALSTQRKFWFACGLLAIGFIVLYVLMIFAVMGVAMQTAL